jgi:hypothetical protein
MQRRRLRGEGGVYITSPTRNIDCDELDYDAVTGIATMTALPGRTVTVMTAGNPHPARADRVVWDMINDKITLTNPRAAAPR